MFLLSFSSKFFRTFASKKDKSTVKTPTISIIIPVYNGAKYVSDALSSVVNQTFTDWECIVIDDASTDNSVDIINDFVARDKRFRLIKKDKNSGIGATRNVGLDVARGEYIAFLDQDDFYFQSALESLLWTAREYNADTVIGDFMVVPDEMKYAPSNNTEFNPSQLKIYKFTNPFIGFIKMSEEQGAMWLWRRLWRRDAIKDIRFPEIFISNEDLIFVLYSLANTKNMIQINCAIACHRASNNSESGLNNTVSEYGLIGHLNCMVWVCKIFTNSYPKQFMKIMKESLSHELFYIMLFPMLRDKKYISPRSAIEILKYWNTGVINTRVLPFWTRWKLWAKLKMIATHDQKE